MIKTYLKPFLTRIYADLSAVIPARHLVAREAGGRVKQNADLRGYPRLSALRNRAFTLVEIAASLVILGVALVSILGMFYIGNRSNALSQDLMIACNLLQRKLEEVKCKSFTDINSNDDDEAITVDNSTYTLNVEVDPLDVDLTDFAGANPPLKELMVTITWTTRFGGTKTETAYTLIADY